MAADLQLLVIGSKLLYTFDFSAEVPSPATVTGIDYTLPSQLSSFVDQDDLANSKGTLGLEAHTTNGKHGQTVQVKAVATLTNNEKVTQLLNVRLVGG